jgi:diguanylate cyclase (GGDEF)-like protein
LFVDLDDFKSVNDSFGHEAGDHLLTAVGERLQSCLRTADTAARLGGDEFAVLLQDVEGAEEATQIARRILGSLRAPFALGSHEVSVEASIGIALHGGARGRPATILRKADLALYRAKREVKGGYTVASPGLETMVGQE